MNTRRGGGLRVGDCPGERMARCVAEACGNRTHRPAFGGPTGFEDRESHQAQSASFRPQDSESLTAGSPLRKALRTGSQVGMTDVNGEYGRVCT